MSKLPAFKAYDIRGRLGDEINRDIAWRIGRAYAQVIKPEKVVLGQDVRLTSKELSDAVALGLIDQGVEVYDIGLCGTEEVYFATFEYAMDGGIMTTASHNPMDYNGMKLVREQSRPIGADSGLGEIEALVAVDDTNCPAHAPQLKPLAHREAYIQHLLGYVADFELKPLRIVVNAGNGPAGAIVDALAPHLPFEFIRIQHEPDGRFPNGIPNPLLPENRQATADAVRAHQADFGVAWDGDFDRCFLFDEHGEFIEGYYIVGLLAQALLETHPGSNVIYDVRMTWNTIDIVEAAGGQAIEARTGHAFIKQIMRDNNAIYGGEMSAHHYFRDFAYCDNGNIPWLMVAALVSQRAAGLSTLVSERIAAYPSSGEINRTVNDAKATIERVAERYSGEAKAVSRVDGLSVEFANWRFNLRASNTEPVIRLNVESRADKALVEAKTRELLGLIGGR
ncbi:MAG: phosphomannomutase [Oceanococcus sp.]|nr:MAG: phosphomannomutase [Oceanococcus sp.]